MRAAAQVTVLWGATPIAVAHVRGGHAVAVSEDGIVANVPMAYAGDGIAVRMHARAATLSRSRPEPAVDFARCGPRVPVGEQVDITLRCARSEVYRRGGDWEAEPLVLRVAVDVESSRSLPRAFPAARSWAVTACSAVMQLALLLIAGTIVPEMTELDGELEPDRRYLVIETVLGGPSHDPDEPPIAGAAPEVCAALDEPTVSRVLAIQGPADNVDAHLASQRGSRDATWDTIGQSRGPVSGDPDAPTAPWGRDDSLGVDPYSARSYAWTERSRSMAACFDEPPPTGGCSHALSAPATPARLGLHGIGDDALVSQQAWWRHRPARVALGPVLVSANVPPWLVRAGIRAVAESVRGCYDRALSDEPTLAGVVDIVMSLRAGEVSARIEASQGAARASALLCCVEAAQDSLVLELPEGTRATARYSMQLGTPRRVSPSG